MLLIQSLSWMVVLLTVLVTRSLSLESQTNGTSGHTNGVVEVTKIYDNVGDVIKVIGVGSATYKPYNQLYRITGVAIGSATTVSVSAASSLSSSVITTETLGVGSTLTTDSYFYLTGESKSISALDYTIAGIATLTTVGSHGFCG